MVDRVLGVPETGASDVSTARTHIHSRKKKNSFVYYFCQSAQHSKVGVVGREVQKGEWPASGHAAELQCGFSPSSVAAVSAGGYSQQIGQCLESTKL